MKRFFLLLLFPMLLFGEGSETLKLGTSTHNVQSPTTINWIGTTLDFTGATVSGLPGGGGGGTVTSVGVSGANGIGSSGGPITTSGTIALTLPITLAGTSGKTLTVSNSLTLAGTDSSTLNIGAGGTLGSAAFTSSGAYQPLDSDLTTIAGLTATTDNFMVAVSSAWDSRTPSQVRTTLGLVPGTDVQAFDSDLTTWAGITPGTGVGTALAVNVGSAGAFVVNGGALGTPSSGTATNLTGTASGLTAGNATTLATSRNLWGQAFNGSAAVAGAIELGTSGTTDTTLDRASAGVMSVEGVNVLTTTAIPNTTAILKGNSAAGSAAASNITVTSGQNYSFDSNQNSGTSFDVKNTTAGTGALAQVRAISAGPNRAYLVSYNSSYTASGLLIAGAAEVSSDATLVLDSKNAALDLSTDFGATSTLGLSYTTVASGTSATLDAVRIPARTNTITGTTQITTAKGFNHFSIYQPTYTDSSAVTIDRGATVYIEGAPTAAGSVTLTAPYALWVDSGTTRLDGTIELGDATDTTVSRSSAGVIAVEGVVIPSISSTNTLSNKRVLPRTHSTSSATSWTPDFDTYDVEIQTALAGAVTINAPTYASANEGELRMLRIKDNGTARGITWTEGSSGAFRFSSDLAKPTTTTLGKTMYLRFIYNSTDSRWDLLAKLDNF